MIFRISVVLESIETDKDGDIKPYTDKTLDRVDIPPMTEDRVKANCLFEKIISLCERG